MTSVGIAVLTYNSRHHLEKCLFPLVNSPLKPRIVVVDSSSHDGTVELAEQFGVETLTIPKSMFNHGLTRELARKTLNTDIIVMVTPDAYAKNNALEVLLDPLFKNEASLAYARQIPHAGAKIWEAFPRYFNYPAESNVRSIKDVDKYGVYTFFFSDSFGAYKNLALEEIGGFERVLTGEDTVACAKLLLKGHKVAYVADAEVYHSHDYSLIQEFRRHFDTGFARKTYGDLFAFGGKDSKRGKEYVKALFAHLFKKNPFLIPYACFQVFSKWLGYQLGRKMVKAPVFLKKFLSSQDAFWI